MPNSRVTQIPNAEDAIVVTKAVLRAADCLQLTNKILSNIIGLSESTLSRMRNGNYTLDPGSKEYELSVLLVRFYRSLDALTGGSDSTAIAWLNNPNTALNNVPIDSIQTISGLNNAIQYLDTRRAIL